MSIMEMGSVEFLDTRTALTSPLALHLFGIKGVKGLDVYSILMEFVSSGQPLFHSEEDRENASPQNTHIKPSLVLSPYPLVRTPVLPGPSPLLSPSSSPTTSRYLPCPSRSSHPAAPLPLARPLWSCHPTLPTLLTLATHSGSFLILPGEHLLLPHSHSLPGSHSQSPSRLSHPAFISAHTLACLPPSPPPLYPPHARPS
ncbi:hypothetical protein EI94DRAFT_1817270 [Lactarius quietus]|nr:hypothetical protein EI94DRAFT_1817270 [Lactarius quietus]